MIAFPAGGPTHLTMRVRAENATKLIGQAVVVENRPGAGGTLPAQALQHAKPDGHTLAQIPLGVSRLPCTPKIHSDPVKDITDLLGITGHGFGGVVTSPHLTMEDIAPRLGRELNHIPYKGSADLMQSLLGG